MSADQPLLFQASLNCCLSEMRSLDGEATAPDLESYGKESLVENDKRVIVTIIKLYMYGM